MSVSVRPCCASPSPSPSPSPSAYSQCTIRQFHFSIKSLHPHAETLSSKLRRTAFEKHFPIKGGTARRANPPASSIHVSPWDDKPHQVLPGGQVSYYDERDVVTFLDPPKQLIPSDPSSYNPAAYLWKKIDDIPEERRHRLLALLNPRLISRAWEVAVTRYDDSKLAKRSASTLLAGEAGAKLLEFWHCRTNGGPWAVAWINHFKKALFCREDGQTFGRIIDASMMGGSRHPLYFRVREVNEVMSTEEACDVAYEFGSGLLDVHTYEYPDGFPKPGKHPWPLNDQVVIYVRYVGPGVAVGQAWQEGLDLEQVPKKLCADDILMVKDYARLHQTW